MLTREILLEKYTRKALTLLGCTDESQDFFMENFKQKAQMRENWDNNLRENKWENLSQNRSGVSDAKTRKALKAVGTSYLQFEAELWDLTKRYLEASREFYSNL